MRKSGVFSMVSDDLNFREVACSFPSEKFTPTSESVASNGSDQNLGFKMGIAIVSLNTNGLRSHLDEVQLLMRDLVIQKLAVNETKLDPCYPKELISVAGCQQERLDRTRTSGDVSIYVWDSIKYKRRLDVPTDDLELIYIEVKLG